MTGEDNIGFLMWQNRLFTKCTQFGNYSILKLIEYSNVFCGKVTFSLDEGTVLHEGCEEQVLC